MVEAQHAADAFAPLHAPVVIRRRIAVDDQGVGQALMRALAMIMLDEFGDEQVQVTLTERHDMVQVGFIAWACILRHRGVPKYPLPAVWR